MHAESRISLLAGLKDITALMLYMLYLDLKGIVIFKARNTLLYEDPVSRSVQP